MPFNNNDYIIGPHANRPDIGNMLWNPDKPEAVNAHLLICGGSGAGKTVLIKDIVSYLASRGKHIFVFDLKGDMEFKGENGNQVGNYIEITAWASEYGLSMFEFDTGVSEERLQTLIDDPSSMSREDRFKIQNSGPKVQVNRLIEILMKNFFPNLGVKQKDYLKALFTDTFILKGFKYDDITTWLKELPTLEDTLEIITMIRKYAQLGMEEMDGLSSDFISAIKPIVIDMNILNNRIKSGDFDGADEKDKLEKLVNTKTSALREKYDTYLTCAKDEFREAEVLKENPSKWFDDKKIDVKKYSSKDAVRKVEELESYLRSLHDSELFHGSRMPVKSGLNVINISGLEVSFQRVFVDIFLGKVFKACKIKGEYGKRSAKERERGAKVNTYCVVDESKLIAGSSKEKNDPYSYQNRIATESRSNGLGLIVASQSAEHFPPEFLKNFHLQIVLNTGTADAETVKKSFNLSKDILAYTQLARNNGLVKNGKDFIKTKMESHTKLGII